MQYTLQRSGHAPLQFDGEIISESYPDGEPVRWHELRVYRTRGGSYVAQVYYCTRWEGEVEHRAAEVCETPAAVADYLRAYDPGEHVMGYPPGAQMQAKQERMLQELRLNYEDQVSRVLDSEEFAEKIS